MEKVSRKDDESKKTDARVAYESMKTIQRFKCDLLMIIARTVHFRSSPPHTSPSTVEGSLPRIPV